MASSGGTRAYRDRIGRLYRQAFRDRTILIRDAAGVRSFVFTARLQHLLAGTALGVVLFAAGAVGTAMWQHQALTQQAVALDEAQARYDDLRGKVIALHSEADDLVTENDAGPPGGEHDLSGSGESVADAPVEAVRRDLNHLAEANRKLTRRIARVRAGVRGADARAEELAKERNRLQARLEAAKTALDRAIDRRKRVRRDLAALENDKRNAEIRERAFRAAAHTAGDRASRADERLAQARQRVAALREEVKAVEERLTASRARRQALLAERAGLADNVRGLEKKLGLSGSGTGSLMDRVGQVAQALREAEERERSLTQTKEKLRERVETLERKLASVREQGAGVFEKLSSRTEDGLERVRKTVEMTGIESGKLVKRVAANYEGARGGPLVELADDEVDALTKQASTLSRKMERMLALQKALGHMPLSAPVESYWISSYYGKRRDPYTDEWAMHEGLDLAADAGSDVRATAPGRVVSVGTRGGYGRMVKIDHGLGLTTVYGHMRNVSVENGERVDHRAKVGELGSTGRSTGPHVHYEVRMDGQPIDPTNFLKAGKHVFKG